MNSDLKRKTYDGVLERHPDRVRFIVSPIRMEKGYYRETNLKFLAFALLSYERVVFMDVDVMILKPYTMLFDAFNGPTSDKALAAESRNATDTD